MPVAQKCIAPASFLGSESQQSDWLHPNLSLSSHICTQQLCSGLPPSLDTLRYLQLVLLLMNLSDCRNEDVNSV